MTDPIADYLTRLRNAIKAGHRVVEVPASNLKKEITRILFEKGYILSYKFVEDGPQGSIKVALKYDPMNKVNAIKCLNSAVRFCVTFINKEEQLCQELENFLSLSPQVLPLR